MGQNISVRSPTIQVVTSGEKIPTLQENNVNTKTNSTNIKRANRQPVKTHGQSFSNVRFIDAHTDALSKVCILIILYYGETRP